MNEQIDIEEYAPWMVLLITLVGGALRLILLAYKGMWLDETFSVWLASHSVADLLHWVVQIDQHPPLYYLLLHSWIGLNGDAPYEVRLLSALFGAGTIPLIYLIGKRMAGVGMGLAAAVLLAFSPFNVYYAQEARMYTLLAFNTAAAIYALVRLLTDERSVQPIGRQLREYLRVWRNPEAVEAERADDLSQMYAPRGPSQAKIWVFPRRWPPLRMIETDLSWAALIVFSAAALYTHNTAFLFLLAVNLFVLGLMIFQRLRKPDAQPDFQPPSFSNWVKAQVGILILWLPWMMPFFKQASAVYQHFWIPAPTWDSVLQVLRTFLNPPISIPAEIAPVIWILYGLALCLGLVYFRKKFTQFLFLVALFAVPFLAELIVSIWRPIFLDRTLIWITIPLFLLLAAGVMQLRFRLLVILGLGVFSVINLLSDGDYYRFYQKEDWSAAARAVAGFAEQGDLILFNSNFVEIPFNYYFKDYETYRHLKVEKQGVPLDLLKDSALEPVMTAADIPGLLSLVSGRPRVWLVYSHADYTDPLGLIPRTLASHMKLVRSDEFYGGRVQLYVSP